MKCLWLAANSKEYLEHVKQTRHNQEEVTEVSEEVVEVETPKVIETETKKTIFTDDNQSTLENW